MSQKSSNDKVSDEQENMNFKVMIEGDQGDENMWISTMAKEYIFVFPLRHSSRGWIVI